MKILLDTHILLKYVNGDSLPTKISKSLKDSDKMIVSAISFWEIAMLVKYHFIELNQSPLRWYQSALQQLYIREIPISAEISNEAVSLSWVHKDPADRWIVATAIVEGAVLATLDHQIRKFETVTCL